VVAGYCELAAPKAEPNSLPEYQKARFPRTVRLLHKREFGQVFGDAKPFGAATLTVLARPNSFGHARLGMVIGKKKIRRSVDRNLMKRIIRESFRTSLNDLPAVDLVVIARPAKQVDRKALAQDLQKQWRRIRKAYLDGTAATAATHV